MAFPERLLNEGEQVLVDTHPHWWIFAGVVTRLVLVLAIAIWAVAKFEQPEFVNYIGVALIALAVLNLLVVYLKWRTTDFVLTSDRLVTRSGILSRNSREIPLERVNDLSCHQSLFERIIHAGDLMVESGGEMGQSTFHNFGDPFELQNAVHSRDRSSELTLRIGMVCPYSLTIPGGVQMQVLALGRALRDLGHTVQVLSPCDGPPPEPGVTPLGKSIPWATNGSVAPIAPDPWAAVRTIRALRSERFDVVHIHEPLVPGPSLTALLFCDQPTVGTFHRAGASRAYTMLSPVTKRLGKRLTRRVAVSQDALNTARDGVGGEFDILFNGIDVDRFASATPASTEGPTVLFFGRHEERKGLGILLDAAASLPDDVMVWIVGQGPQTDALKAKHAGDPRLQWLGRVDDIELAQRLAGADVFCAPSLFGESFGVVLLEAMAAGTAIVASDLPGYRAVALPDEHAVLVAPEDPDALAKALNELLADPRRRVELVAAGRERAEEFAMAKLAAAYADIYASLLA